MHSDWIAQALWIVALAGMVVAGCDRGVSAQTETTDEASAAASRTNATPPAPLSPTTDANKAAGKEVAEVTLDLEGLTMTIPEGWVAQPIAPGPMAAKAAFAIQNENGPPGSVRVTHYPRMRGMNEQNIRRWISQATKPDGSPIPREDVKPTTDELGEVKLTTVDIVGTIKATMRSAPEPNQRMVASIIDHAEGPHFVVAIGNVDLIKSVHADIMTFLRSARHKP